MDRFIKFRIASNIVMKICIKSYKNIYMNMGSKSMILIKVLLLMDRNGLVCIVRWC